jgi:hypothetical protein
MNYPTNGDTLPPGHGPGGRFAKGNRLGRGNPRARAVELYRTQIIRKLKIEGAIPKIVDVLLEVALEGTAPVRVRRTDKVTGKRRRVVRHLRVGDKSRMTALQELLSRAVGKATEFKVIEDNRPDPSSSAPDLVVVVGALQQMGLPPEHWPVVAREYHARQLAGGRPSSQPPASS